MAHLRAGGTTPWQQWSGEDADSDSPLLPGAIQLEVVRRLNELGGTDQPGHLALIDRILDSSAPGRGQPDLPIAGVGRESGFGPRPVIPEELPAVELARMAVGVIAELAVDRDPGTAAPTRRTPKGWFRRGFRVVGDPVLSRTILESLATAGHHPGRRPRTAIVVASDLGTSLADVWAWRIERGETQDFGRWLRKYVRSDRLPANTDSARIAQRWAEQLGADNVHVVIDRDPAAEVARILGVSLGASGWTSLSRDASELLREINAVLRVLVDRERQERLLAQVIRPWLVDEQGPPRAVPLRHQEWVHGRAERLRERLSAGGYPVHGDPALLGDVREPRAASARAATVLEVALRTLQATRKESG